MGSVEINLVPAVKATALHSVEDKDTLMSRVISSISVSIIYSSCGSSSSSNIAFTLFIIVVGVIEIVVIAAAAVAAPLL